MAQPQAIPLPARVSIAWLAGGKLDVGLSPAQMIEVAVRYVYEQGPRRRWWVVDRGWMQLFEFTDLYWPKGADLLFGNITTNELIRRCEERIIEQVLWGPADVAEFVARLGAPLPPRFAAWAKEYPLTSLELPIRRPGRPSKADEIRAAYRQLPLEKQRAQRSKMRWEIRWALHPELRGDPKRTIPDGLGDDAIDNAIRPILRSDAAPDDDGVGF
jgi:hypothetical protein